MSAIDYLMKFRRAKRLETLTIMFDAKLSDCENTQEQINVILAHEHRENEIIFGRMITPQL